MKRQLNAVLMVFLFAYLKVCSSNSNSRDQQPKSPPSKADLLEAALRKFNNREAGSTHDITQREYDVINDEDRIHYVRREQERSSRLTDKPDGNDQTEMTSEKRKDVTSGGEIITEEGFDGSDGEVQTVKRRDETFKKKEKTGLSNPTYQFFLIAILVFSGVGVFMAISVAIVYLVKRIQDDDRRNTIEMDDKGHVGLYYYQCSDTSNYSDMGSTYTSHSHLSDDVGRYGAQDDMMSPFSDDDNVNSGNMATYNGHVSQPLPGKSWSTRIQPDYKDSEYGTFYNNLSKSTSAENKGEMSKMADDYNWSMNPTSDRKGLLQVTSDNKRPKSY